MAPTVIQPGIPALLIFVCACASPPPRVSTPASPAPTAPACEPAGADEQVSEGESELLAAGPFSLGSPQAGEMLWRRSFEVSESTVLGDGAGGVYVIAQAGDDAAAQRVVGRLDASGQVTWSRVFAPNGYKVAARLPEGGLVLLPAPFRETRGDEIDFISADGKLERVSWRRRTEPPVVPNLVSVGSDGSIAIVGAVQPMKRAGLLDTMSTQFLAKLSPKRKLQWITMLGLDVPRDVRVLENGTVAVLRERAGNKLERLIYADSESPPTTTPLPECVSGILKLDAKGGVYALGSACYAEDDFVGVGLARWSEAKGLEWQVMVSHTVMYRELLWLGSSDEPIAWLAEGLVTADGAGKARLLAPGSWNRHCGDRPPFLAADTEGDSLLVFAACKNFGPRGLRTSNDDVPGFREPFYLERYAIQ